MFSEKKNIAFQEICKELKKIKKRLNIKKYDYEQTYYEKELHNKVRIYFKKFSFEVNKNELEEIRRIKFKNIKTKKHILSYYINNVYEEKFQVNYTNIDLMMFTCKGFNFFLKNLKLTKIKDFNEITKIKDINWELFFGEKLYKRLNPEDEIFTISQKNFKLIIAKEYFIFYDRYNLLFFNYDINFLKNQNFEILEDYYNNFVFKLKNNFYIYSNKKALKYKYFDFMERIKTDKKILKDGNLLVNFISQGDGSTYYMINEKKILYKNLEKINRNDEFYLSEENYIVLEERENYNNYKIFKNNLIFDKYYFISYSNIKLDKDIFILSSQYSKAHQEQYYYDLIVLCHYNDMYVVKRSFLEKYKFDLENIPLEKIKEENDLVKLEVSI